MKVLYTIRANMVETFGKRGGFLLAQQAVERVAVACMMGVGAEFLSTSRAVHGAPARPCYCTGLCLPPFLPQPWRGALSPTPWPRSPSRSPV